LLYLSCRIKYYVMYSERDSHAIGNNFAIAMAAIDKLNPSTFNDL